MREEASRGVVRRLEGRTMSPRSERLPAPPRRPRRAGRRGQVLVEFALIALALYLLLATVVAA